MTRKALSVFFFISFLNLFLFRDFGPVGFSLFCFGFIAYLMSIYADRKNASKQMLVGGAAYVSLSLISLALLNRTTGFTVGLLVTTSLMVLALVVYLLATGKTALGSLMEAILFPFLTGWSYIKSFFTTLGKVITVKTKLDSDKQGLRSWTTSPLFSLAIGLVIGLPTIFVLISMLSQADPIFNSAVKNALGEDFMSTLASRGMWSLFFLGVFVPFLFLHRKPEFHNPLGGLYRFDFANIFVVVVGLVAATMAAFLFIQWPYVFATVAAETDLSKLGVATYSEYVQKGFGELIKVSLFLYGLIWLGLIALRGTKTKTAWLLRAFQLTVLGEFGIFLISLFRRIWLYQHHHGLSLVRIFGGWFLVLIAVFTITLLLRHFWTKRWAMVEVAALVLLVAALGFSNVEDFIARNDPPTVNKRIDYTYLVRLSPDGYYGWKRSYDYAQSVLNDQNLLRKISPVEAEVDKHERQQIAYSSIVLKKLFNNHYELLMKYGTDEEKKEYFTTLTRYSLEHTNRTLESLRARDPNSVFPPKYRGSITGLQYYQEKIKELEGNKANLEKYLTLLTTRPLSELYASAYFRNHFSQGNGSQTYNNYDCQHLSICKLTDISNSYLLVHSFYTVDVYERIDGTKSEPTSLDRFLTYNKTEAEVYQDMKSDIPYNQLLSLQYNFFQLYGRVTRQLSEGAKDYEQDVSFNAPFLEGF